MLGMCFNCRQLTAELNNSGKIGEATLWVCKCGQLNLTTYSFMAMETREPKVNELQAIWDLAPEYLKAMLDHQWALLEKRGERHDRCEPQ